MQENGQLYVDHAALIPAADRRRFEDAEREEMRDKMDRWREEAERDRQIQLDRAAMREAIAAQREERGLPPVRGAEEEIAPEAR